MTFDNPILACAPDQWNCNASAPIQNQRNRSRVRIMNENSIDICIISGIPALTQWKSHCLARTRRSPHTHIDY